MHTYTSEKDAVLTFTTQPLFHITGGTQKNYRTFQSRYYLFSGSGPVGLPPVRWTEKTIDMSPFCCCGDLVGRATF